MLIHQPIDQLKARLGSDWKEARIGDQKTEVASFHGGMLAGAGSCSHRTIDLS